MRSILSSDVGDLVKISGMMNAKECKQVLIKHARPECYKLSFRMVMTSDTDSTHD